MSEQNPKPSPDSTPGDPSSVGEVFETVEAVDFAEEIAAAENAVTAESMWHVTQGQTVVAPQTSGSAIVALVLSIVSWLVCPIIPAIVALVFANRGAKEIAASGGLVSGDGLITASKVIAWINIGFWAALFVIGLLSVALIAIVSSL